nr:MAG TPA: hypothetical protein [Caudoviricetes sp.]
MLFNREKENIKAVCASCTISFIFFIKGERG